MLNFFFQLKGVLGRFVDGNKNIRNSLVRRLEEVREKFEESPYFMSHEVSTFRNFYLVLDEIMGPVQTRWIWYFNTPDLG